MKQKLTELMREWEDKEALILDEEIQAVSLERIKALALKGINEKKKTKRKFRKGILLVAVVGTLLSLTLVAEIIKPSFNTFFGDQTNLLTEEMQDIEKRIVKNGIIVTLEQAVVDETGAMISFNLQKEDGSVFQEGTEIGEINLESSASGMGWRTNSQLSEDRKTLMYYLLMDQDTSIYDKKITLTLNNLVQVKEGEKVLEESIYELYEQYPVEKRGVNVEEAEGIVAIDDELLVGTEQTGLLYKCLEEVPSFMLQAVGFIDHKLQIQTELTEELGRSSSWARVSYLLNQSTGEKVYYNQGRSLSINEEERIAEKVVEVTSYELTLTDKLKNIYPVISYEQKQMLQEETWQVDFKLSKNTKVKYKGLDIHLEDDMHKVELQELYVSTIGITLKAESINKYSKKYQMSNIDIPVVAYMKDGTRIDYPGYSKTSGENGQMIIRYNLSGEELLEIDCLSYVMIGEEKIEF